MPSIVSVILHPETRRPGPPAARINLVRVFLAGMALWLVAGVVALIHALTTTGPVGSALWVCAVGLVLGGGGILWGRRHRG